MLIEEVREKVLFLVRKTIKESEEVSFVAQHGLRGNYARCR